MTLCVCVCVCVAGILCMLVLKAYTHTSSGTNIIYVEENVYVCFTGGY